MSIRTTALAVQKVLMEDYATNEAPDLTPFMEAASSLVDDVISCAANKGKSLSASKLELLERWLSAHFYQQSDKGYSSKSTAGASASFQGQTAMRLESTQYGQMAMVLDSSGCLFNINSNAVVQGFWLGKTSGEQLDYDDRNP